MAGELRKALLDRVTYIWEGRYRSPRTAEWSGWMPMIAGPHNWGGQQFELRMAEGANHVHQWVEVESITGQGDHEWQRLKYVTAVACPDCMTVRRFDHPLPKR